MLSPRLYFSYQYLKSAEWLDLELRLMQGEPREFTEVAEPKTQPPFMLK